MDPDLWKSRFAEHLALRGFSSCTIVRYTGEVAPLLDFLDSQGVTSLSQVTQEGVEAYREHLFLLRPRGRALSLRTQSARLQAVKAFFRFLVRGRFLLIDPAAAVALPRTRGGLPRVLLSEPDVARLLAATDTSTPLGLRDRAAMEVLYGSALRNSELGALTLDAVDLERRELRVLRGKGGKSRVVPLGDEAAHWLEAYLRRGRSAFVVDGGETRVFLTRRGRGMDVEAVGRIVARAAATAGIDGKVRPHDLRHCCATHMLARGAGIRHLQELLGHACLSSTQRYTRVELSDLRRVHRLYHPRERKEDA